MFFLNKVLVVVSAEENKAV